MLLFQQIPSIHHVTMPHSDSITRFQRDVCKNRFMAGQLRLRQAETCTVCFRTMGSKGLVIHHMDYAHECTWTNTIVVTVAKGKRSIPDCQSCHADDMRRFNSCRRRLQLLHGRCHFEYHRGQKALRPIT
ncbi:hypothetical protein CWS72_07965 [Telmatospirillum siberiense]|uniref:Uncharacterized protein n=1 Tax=Telmatospirillum siberiense TaxID=382514 RepID=A0A2N3PXJ1_9PROT|nr:hypothetical protein CWS72_07965 [Telmatospirillum siberiense]